ncbi:CvpA family protein [Uliginosibacterium sp. 31-16]|uniref:CvpA family protein n=1 Tax=Uliginosibacterium sp. 31-16 TaxID=3068315 RepID=UPI00273F794F|nr:CvpA family protein [Uliginosibacterium sp. 31-16]MDP5239790.1 CvpA family protein [Uliginosibacterium sp. 31-16]
MSGFDYVFLGFLLLSVLLGLWRGLISEIFALLGWVVAIAVAWQAAKPLAPFLDGIIQTPWLRWPLAFLLVFIALLIVLAVLRWILRSLLAASGLSPVDRFLGGCFGAVRALVVAVLLVAAAGMSSLPKESWWREAVFAPPLETAVIAAKPWLPKELGQRIKYRDR